VSLAAIAVELTTAMIQAATNRVLPESQAFKEKN